MRQALMVRLADMKRFGSLAVALLLMLTVLGPTCLMLASTAMAMPSHVEESGPCDTDPGSVVCPLEQPDGTLVSKIVPPELESAQVEMLDADITLAIGRAPAAAAFPIPESPPSHLTPLRI